MSQEGRCLCGQYSYVINADPLMTLACHCKNCQRQSGSALSINVGFPAAALESEGELAVFDDTADSGNIVHRHFCKTCGSPVYSTLDAAPGLVLIKAGTLDNTEAVSPQMHVWCDSAQPWVDISADLPRFETNPPSA